MMIGETLAHYRILDELGAGGMGEVYLAEDTTFGRRVALKLLPAELAQSPERLERSEREARTVAGSPIPWCKEEAYGTWAVPVFGGETRRWLANALSVNSPSLSPVGDARAGTPGRKDRMRISR